MNIQDLKKLILQSPELVNNMQELMDSDDICQVKKELHKEFTDAQDRIDEIIEDNPNLSEQQLLEIKEFRELDQRKDWIEQQQSKFLKL